MIYRGKNKRGHIYFSDERGRFTRKPIRGSFVDENGSWRSSKSGKNVKPPKGKPDNMSTAKGFRGERKVTTQSPLQSLPKVRTKKINTDKYDIGTIHEQYEVSYDVNQIENLIRKVEADYRPAFVFVGARILYADEDGNEDQRNTPYDVSHKVSGSMIIAYIDSLLMKLRRGKTGESYSHILSLHINFIRGKNVPSTSPKKKTD